MDSQQLLHRILGCVAQLDAINDSLSKISDATTLPFSPAEGEVITANVEALEKLLASGRCLIGNEVARWGL